MRRLVALVAALAAVLPGCGGSDADLVVYSGRNEALFKPILDGFAKKTGLQISVRFGDTTDLAGTIVEEGERPRADVFVGQDAGALGSLAERGLLEPYSSSATEKVPAKYRAADNAWIGLSARARVLIANTEQLEPDEYPTSVFELTDPKWRGKVAAPSVTNASWIGFISEMRIDKGDVFTRTWLEDMKANDLAVLGSHTDVRNAVGSGEFEVGLVNHYYVELEKREGSPVEAVFTDQGEDGFGVVVNAASGGILKNAENRDNAERLMDYLVSSEVQEEFAGLNYEYPVVPGIPAPGLMPLTEVKATDIPLADLAPKLDSTVAMLREVGLGE